MGEVTDAENGEEQAVLTRVKKMSLGTLSLQQL